MTWILTSSNNCTQHSMFLLLHRLSWLPAAPKPISTLSSDLLGLVLLSAEHRAELHQALTLTITSRLVQGLQAAHMPTPDSHARSKIICTPTILLGTR